MQKRVVLVSAAVAALGLAAAVLGFVSESVKSKAFVRYDGQRCVYQRTAAFGCGIAAAVLVLAGMSIVTAASGCFGRYGGGSGPGRRRSTASSWLPVIAWVVVLVAAMLFLYGASRNAGGTSDRTRFRTERRFNRTFYYGCAMVRSGVFATASVASGIATACAIAAYVNLQHVAEPAAQDQFAQHGVATGQPQWSQPYPAAAPSQFAQPGVAMGHPQWPQPYPPAPGHPPVVYPLAPHHGYGDGYAGK